MAQVLLRRMQDDRRFNLNGFLVGPIVPFSKVLSFALLLEHKYIPYKDTSTII